MEDYGCLKAISYPLGFWIGAMIGAAIAKDSGVGIGCILGVVAVYFIWKTVEEEQKAAREREKENERRRWEHEAKERKRKEAIDLARKYPEATKHFFLEFWGINKSVIYDTDITFERAEKLLTKRYSFESEEVKHNAVYRAKVEAEKEAERRRQEAKKEAERKEAERKRQEEELARQRKEAERRNLSTLLPACVASWNTHSNSTLKHKYYYDYYSYSQYKNEASSNMWDAWFTVWHFKNDPTKNVTEVKHKNALNIVTNLIEETLRTTFGSKTEYLTLVCLTASTQRKTELRFKEFAEKVCSDLNMINAYPHIRVVEDGSAKHDGGDGSRKVSYDRYFFKDKFIVLFDDVRTSGRSLEKERRTLEQFGATVICAITIAQTKR